jgi:hypothetical protein
VICLREKKEKNFKAWFDGVTCPDF